jgi:hypothetical protein
MERASARGFGSRAMERAPARDIAERLRIIMVEQSYGTSVSERIEEQSHGRSASERHCGATTNYIIVEQSYGMRSKSEELDGGAELWNEIEVGGAGASDFEGGLSP